MGDNFVNVFASYWLHIHFKSNCFYVLNIDIAFVYIYVHKTNQSEYLFPVEPFSVSQDEDTWTAEPSVEL